MNKREIGGLIVLIAGFLICIFSLIFGDKERFVGLIYGIPILIIGLIIMLNKNEDKIEQVKSRGGKK